MTETTQGLSSAQKVTVVTFGPFATEALKLHDKGIPVFPCGSKDGKKPRVQGWQKPHARKTIIGWQERFGDANIGVPTGPQSQTTIVDIDDPALLDRMLAHFGNTPLITQSPSGGYHLWYRWNGERSSNLRPKLAVDIKAKGGLIIVPPSRRPEGNYRFIRGSWDDLGNLSVTKSNTVKSGPVIREGNRNRTIFRALLKQVQYCDDWAAFFDVASTINDNHTEEPLPEKELHKIVNSVWGYAEREEIWGGVQRVTLTATEIDLLTPYPNALALWLIIRRHHWDKSRGPFALCADAMAKEGVIPGCPSSYKMEQSVA